MVSEEIWKQRERNRDDVAWWIHLLKPFAPPLFGASVASSDTPPVPLRFLHAYMAMQGPNYALAKMLQVWRCILVESCTRGRISFHHGPSTETRSVLGVSPLMRQFTASFTPLKPLELFPKTTTKPVLGYLLLSDVFDVENFNCDPCFDYDNLVQKSHSAALNVQAASGQPVQTHHIMEVFVRGGQFHGGLLNVGYDVQASKVLAMALMMRSKL